MTTMADLSCDAAGSLVADYIRGELHPPEREAMVAHLDACPVCQARVGFEQGLRDQLQALGRAPVPVAVLERVRSITGRSSLGTSTAPRAGG
jgi:anti-sigma factor RsiW